MLSRIIGAAALTGFLLAVSAPVTFAATAKTKEECAKLKDHTWNDATSKCEKTKK